jgi:hypothetical protein
MGESHFLRRWRVIITTFTFVALAILIFAVRRQIAQTFHNLSDVNASVLLLIIPLQALNYHCYTNLYRRTFTILNVELPYKPMYRIALELNFVNNVFPSAGLSTFSYFNARLKPFRVAGSKTTLVQFMRFILVFVSFQMLLFVGLFMLALGGKASDLMILIAGSLVTLLFIFTVTSVYVIGSQKRINATFTFVTRVLNRLIGVVRRKHPETINIARVQRVFNELHENYLVIRQNLDLLKRPLFYALGANLTEVLTIYSVYVAFGHWVNPGAIIIAYAIANFAGLISVLPGGVGIYEALTTAVLVTAGVPAGLGISATVMYRILSMSLQIPPGYYFYYKFMHAKSGHTG